MLRNHFLRASFLLFSVAVYAQYDASPERIDSLKTQLKSLPKDSTRMDPLINLWRAHVNRDIDKSFYYASELIKLGKAIKHVPTLYTGYQRMGITYSYNDNYKKSNEYYRKGLQLSIEHEEYSCIAVMHLNMGINFLVLNQHDSTLYHTHKSAENFLIVNDSTGYAGSMENISSVHFQKGHYNLALEYALNAIRIYDKYSDVASIRNALYTKSKIAQNYLKMKDTAKAIEYFEEIIPIYRERDDKLGLSANLAGLGLIYTYNKKHLSKAKEILLESRDVAKSIKSTSIMINSYFGLGIYHKKMGLAADSEKYFKESFRLADSLGQKGNVIDNQLQLAEIAFGKKNFTKSMKMGQNALSIAIENDLLEAQLQAYKLLAEASHNLNREGEALSYYKRYKTINDSIYNIENGQKLSELQTIYETERKEAEIVLQENEIKNLNQEVEISNLRKGLYAGGMISALALSGLLVFGFRQRIKKNRIAREKQEEIYKQEIAHKKKELTSQTLHLVQKNTFIQELMENLQNIKNSPDKFKTEFRRIVMLLKKENASDKDWEVFKTYFADVHNDFDQKLKTLYAEISEKEIRLAAFLRMNLTTKEIAATLNVLPDSILKSKYRLKKKLNLDKETDLNQFLNAL